MSLSEVLKTYLILGPSVSVRKPYAQHSNQLSSALLNNNNHQDQVI